MKIVLAGLLLTVAASAQEMDLGFGPAPVKGQQVSYIGEPVVIAAGKRRERALRFQVRAGYHVNSHTPHSDLLIATRLELAGAKVKVEPAGYPAGKPFRVGDETLDVYADDFFLRVPVTAPPGRYSLEGTLKYQACDRAACYPPRTLPVTVLFEAK